MGTRRQRIWISMALGIALFAALNMLADALLFGARLDLTEDGLYTLSEGTDITLEAIEEPIRVRYFFSEKLATPYPGIFAYGKRVRDMLKEYASIAGPNFALEIIDPAPFTEAEDLAVELGLSGAPTGGGESIYFGLHVSDSLDGEAVIPFFAQEREKFLEYDLTRTIASLGAAAKPRLGLLTTLPMQFGSGGIMAFAQGQSRPWVIYSQLMAAFDVEVLRGGFEELPADLDVLMLAHPPALSDAQAYWIDQFVLGGGRVLAFIDPYTEASANMPPPNPMGQSAAPPIPESSNLPRLLEAWGLEMDTDKVVVDFEIAQRVNMGDGAIKDFIPWLGLSEDYLDAGDIVTGNLKTLNLAHVGALQTRPAATTDITPLFKSSAVSALIDAELVMGMPDADRLLRDTVPDDAVYTLAARVTGTATSAFDGKPGPDGLQQEGPLAGDDTHLASGTVNLIVVADSDMLEDRFWVQVQDFFGQQVLAPIADNGTFVINAIDNLGGSEALIGLRSRGVTRRPFEVVDEIRRDAESRYRAEEEALKQRLTDAETRLAALEMPAEGGGEILSPEQEAEIDRFRDELLATRRQLREVQRNLREDIEALGNRLAFLNIAGMPILVALFGIGFGLRRRRRAEI